MGTRPDHWTVQAISAATVGLCWLVGYLFLRDVAGLSGVLLFVASIPTTIGVIVTGPWLGFATGSWWPFLLVLVGCVTMNVAYATTCRRRDSADS